MSAREKHRRKPVGKDRRVLRAADVHEIGSVFREGGKLYRSEIEKLIQTADIERIMAQANRELVTRLVAFLEGRGLFDACDREQKLWELRGEMGPRQETLSDAAFEEDPGAGLGADFWGPGRGS